MSGYQTDCGVLQQEAGFGFEGNFYCESYADALVAKVGGGRTGAPKLTCMYNRVATVASIGDSVVLPGIGTKLGLSVCVINSAVNSCQVFAEGSDTINGIAGATGVVQMGQSVVWYTVTQAGKWIAQGLGSGYSGINTTYSYADSLTALAAGGQPGATAITTSTARFTTVATDGDSAILMAAAPGLVITVINAGAKILNVFPATGEQINSLGANIAYAMPPGAVADFICTASGVWHSLLSAPGGAQQAYNAAANTTLFTLSGAQMTGGSAEVTIDLTGTLASGQALTLPTVASLVTAMTTAGLNPAAGMTYEVDFIQRSAANAWTITTNTGWTLTGTMTLSSATMRKCYVTLTSLSAATLRSVGTFTVGAA